MRSGSPAGSWIFGRGPGPAPGPGPGGPGKSRLFHFFPEESLRRGGFSGLFSGIREKSRRTRPPRDFFRDSGDFSGGKVPGVPVCPRNPSVFFIFSNPAHFSAPWAPGAPLFPEKCEKKTRDFDRIRLLKVPKGKVPRSVSQAAAVLRRSVPAGATAGRRGLMLQRRRGIRREVGISGGPPGPPPGRAPGSPENYAFSFF